MSSSSPTDPNKSICSSVYENLIFMFRITRNNYSVIIIIYSSLVHVQHGVLLCGLESTLCSSLSFFAASSEPVI